MLRAWRLFYNREPFDIIKVGMFALHIVDVEYLSENYSVHARRFEKSLYTVYQLRFGQSELPCMYR